MASRIVPPETASGVRSAAHSLGDYQVVADVLDADVRPGGVDYRIMFGPAADVAGEGDGAVAGVNQDVAVIGEPARCCGTAGGGALAPGEVHDKPHGQPPSGVLLNLAYPLASVAVPVPCTR